MQDVFISLHQTGSFIHPAPSTSFVPAIPSDPSGCSLAGIFPMRPLNINGHGGQQMTTEMRYDENVTYSLGCEENAWGGASQRYLMAFTVGGVTSIPPS